MIPDDLRKRRERELELELAARFPGFVDQVELRRLRADPTLGPILLKLESGTGAGADTADLRHAVSEIIPFTQKPSAFGDEPPALEPEPIWPRYWAHNEREHEHPVFFKSSLCLDGLDYGGCDSLDPAAITAELDAIMLSCYGVLASSSRTVDPSKDPIWHGSASSLAEANARYRRLHDQWGTRLQNRTIASSMAKDGTRRDLIATTEYLLANGTPTPMERLGLRALVQNLRAMAITIPHPTMVSRVESVMKLKRAPRPILADANLVVALIGSAFKGVEVVKAPHWTELPLVRLRVAARTGVNRAPVPRSRDGYSFPPLPGYLDLETDENTAQTILADDGLEILDLTALERENLELKKRLSALGHDYVTPEQEAAAAKARLAIAELEQLRVTAEAEADENKGGRPTRARPS